MEKRRIIIPAVIIVTVAGVLIWRASARSGAESRLEASGTVEATEAQLGFQSPGRIEAMRVREGDRVAAGDTLALLERDELLARREQAAAQLAAARALLSELRTGSRPEERVQAREGLEALGARYADAERDLGRTRRLFEAGAVSQEQYDRARLALDVLRAQKEQADQQLRLVETGPRPERIAAQAALVAQAEAALRQADAALRYAAITAPFAGVVTVRHREPGETVGAGLPVATLMNLDERWVRIYIPEHQIGAVRLGAAATISADTYDDRRYRGEVAFIASQAEFTPRNVQTREERVRLVYAVKVRITADSTYDLKPGIPADVSLARP